MIYGSRVWKLSRIRFPYESEEKSRYRFRPENGLGWKAKSLPKLKESELQDIPERDGGSKSVFGVANIYGGCFSDIPDLIMPVALL